jgi:GTP-dependent phosphoenolpyruvate carboxykinase
LNRLRGSTQPKEERTAGSYPQAAGEGSFGMLFPIKKGWDGA